MNINGWIKMHRKLVNWEWWDSPMMVKAWLYICMSAFPSDFKWNGVTIPKGSFFTTKAILMRDLNCSDKFVRSLLRRLKDNGQIEYKGTKRGTIITVLNYDSYQGGQADGGTNKGTNKSTNKSTNKGTIKSTNEGTIYGTSKGTSQGTTIEEYKEYKEYKNNISSSSPCVRACVYVRACESERWLNSQGEMWKEAVAMQLGLKSTEELKPLFSSYQRELISQGREEIKEDDVKKHFVSMMRIKIKDNANQRKPNNIDRDTEFAQHIASQLSGNI